MDWNYTVARFFKINTFPLHTLYRFRSVFTNCATYFDINLPYQVSIATGWTTGVRFQVGTSFLFSTISRPALGPIQPPIQCVPGGLSPQIKLSRREADHSPPFSHEVKNFGSIQPLPHTSSWHNE
jgi:hypothetical protein